MVLQKVKKFLIDGFTEIYYLLVNSLAFILNLSFNKRCGLLIFAGLLLYLPYLNTFNANHDEQYSLLLSRYKILDIIKITVFEDVHPPLFYLYAKFWVSLFKNSEYAVLALRIATYWCFLMTSLLGMFPLKRLLGEKIALVFIGLLFLMPPAYTLAINMRMYPLSMFLISGTFIYAMLVVYKPQKYDWFLFSLFTLLSLYTHYYCAILCAIIWLITFIDLLRLKKYQQLVSWGVSGIIVAILFAPWLFALYLQYHKNNGSWWADMQNAKYAFNGIVMVYMHISDSYYKLCYSLGLLSWLLILLFLLSPIQNIIEKVVVKRAIIVYLSMYFIAYLISIIAFPILVDRFTIIPITLIYISVATALLYFKEARLLFLVLLLFVFKLGYNENYLRVQDKEYSELRTYLQHEISKSSLVLYEHNWGHMAMMFYSSDTNMYFLPKNKHILFREIIKNEEDAVQDLSRYDNIYYLFSFWNSPNKQGCDKSFTSSYDYETHCFKKISHEEALKHIENNKGLREQFLFR